MAQLFKKPDPRRTWEGYRIHFYADEFQPIGSKPLNWLHIHFIGQIGEVEIYLKEETTEYRIVPQWGKVPNHVQTAMRKFVRNNYNDIMEKIRQDFQNLGVELKI